MGTETYKKWKQFLGTDIYMFGFPGEHHFGLSGIVQLPPLLSNNVLVHIRVIRGSCI